MNIIEKKVDQLIRRLAYKMGSRKKNESVPEYSAKKTNNQKYENTVENVKRYQEKSKSIDSSLVKKNDAELHLAGNRSMFEISNDGAKVLQKKLH